MSGIRVFILCKAPIPGRVKTRLIPDYTPLEAARLHEAMARTVIMRARSLFADVCIAADACDHPFFSEFGLPVMAQGDGDLGERLIRLCIRAFAEGTSPVLFLGTDSPHMRTRRLEEAAELIQGHDVVLGPVEDGGYDLIACRHCHPGIFEDIRWSSPYVMHDTLTRAGELELSTALLDMSFDVDHAGDIARARKHGWLAYPAV